MLIATVTFNWFGRLPVEGVTVTLFVPFLNPFTDAMLCAVL